jgi:VanZ family protein
VPVFVYMAFIFTLSSIAQVPQLPEGGDKDLHALLYAGLAFVLARALTGAWRTRLTIGLVLATIAIAGLYGVSDEIHQYFVPPRQSDVMDVAADTVGAAIAAVGLYVWSGIIRGRHDL